MRPDDPSATPSKAEALRAKLDVAKPAIAMAAHNPLAAKLATEAGFDAVWGSGFEALGLLRRAGRQHPTMGTHLEMIRAMGDVQPDR